MRDYPSCQGGVDATTGNIAKHPFMERTGWLFKFDGLSNLNHHPGASRHPSWPGGAIASTEFPYRRYYVTPHSAAWRQLRESLEATFAHCVFPGPDCGIPAGAGETW